MGVQNHDDENVVYYKEIAERPLKKEPEK